MEARALLPRADRSCVIVDQRKGKEEWEQPKGTGRREVLPDIKIRLRACRRARSATRSATYRSPAKRIEPSRTSSSSEMLPRAVRIGREPQRST